MSAQLLSWFFGIVVVLLVFAYLTIFAFMLAAKWRMTHLHSHPTRALRAKPTGWNSLLRH